MYSNLVFLYRATFTMVFPMGMKNTQNFFIIHDSKTVEVFTQDKQTQLAFLPTKERGDYCIDDFRNLATFFYGERPMNTKTNETFDQLRDWFRKQHWNDATIKIEEEPLPGMTTEDWRRLAKLIP